MSISIKHSFNSGDLISILPGIKYLCEKEGKKAIIFQRLSLIADYSHNNNHPIKDDQGRQVCMNRAQYERLKPLIEAQSYVESFEVWDGQDVLFDLDKTRQDARMPLPNGSIHYWPTLIFPQLIPKVDQSWLEVTPITNKNIIINFTERYRNPYISYHFLKEYESQILFVGTPQEHELFCKQWGLNINYLWVRDFHHLAMHMAGCSFFIGCQSMAWHICDGLKVPRILEVCSAYPNTFPTGDNGYAFIAQEALQFYFSNLLKETNQNNG